MNMMTETAFKTNVEKGTGQIKDASDKLSAATEQTSKLVEDTFASAAKGIKDYNLKAVEFAQLNSDAAFDYAKQLMNAKSPSEMLELWRTFARKQVEVLTEQTKGLAMLGQRVANETAEPLSKRSHGIH
jgi:phasin